MKKNEQYFENRKKLIAISQPLRQLMKEGAISTVNEGLHEIYTEQNEQIDEFNTFKQWKKKGKTIIKGSKAFLFWGQPREIEQQKIDDNSTEEEKKMKYFPLAYLFANTQVTGGANNG
jgi:hypothetical protein